MNSAVVYSWLNAVTGLTTICRSKSHGPRPTGPVILEWSRVSEVEVSAPIMFVDPDEGEEFDAELVYHTRNELTLAVNLYGNDEDTVLGYLRKIPTAMKKSGPRKILNAAEAVFLRAGPYRNLSDFPDTKWKVRYQMDLTFLAHFDEAVIEEDFLVDEIELGIEFRQEEGNTIEKTISVGGD